MKTFDEFMTFVWMIIGLGLLILAVSIGEN